MKNRLVTLTFKPLKSGWFRCNQTMQRTKNCDKYRNAHKTLKLSEVKNAERVQTYSLSFWKCPDCHFINDNGVLNQNNLCIPCGKVVYLYKG